MKYIYLDEFLWINIRDYYQGKPRAKEYAGFIALAERNIDNGEWIFPLSLWHHEETKNTGNADKRNSLAQIQQKWSKSWTINSCIQIKNIELDAGISGRKLEKHDVIKQEWPNMFGHSYSEIFHENLEKMKVDLSDEDRQQLFRVYRNLPEHDNIFTSMAIDHSSLDPMKNEQLAYLDSLRNLNSQQKLTKCEILLMNLQDYYDISQCIKIIDNLLPQVVSLSKTDAQKRIVEYFQMFPAFYTSSMLLLEHVKSKDKTKPFHKNDFLDIAILAMAIPYCDVIVTEAHWCEQAKKQDLSRIFDSSIISDINLI